MFSFFSERLISMNANQKIFMGAFVTLLLITSLLSFQQIKAAQKIEAIEKENALFISQITEQDSKIDTLTEALTKAESELQDQAGIVASYEKVSKFINFEELDTSQLERIQKIADETPLDLESAMALVKYADMLDVPYSIVLSMIEIESNFQKDLVGTHEDRGLMQIIPDTEAWLATEYGKELDLEYNPDQIFKPEYNIALGVKYIDILMNSHGTNFERILSEYNRGPYNLEKYYKANQTYSTSYSRTVLSKERKYVALNN